MKIVAIYDNGGKTVDRYTVITNDRNIFIDGVAMFITDDRGGRYFSQWCEGKESILFDKNDNFKTKCYLGQRVRFEHLNQETQKHIAERILL